MADEPGNVELWRGYLHRLNDSRAEHQLAERLIGPPEEETDPELCLIKGEVLLRTGGSDDAQRFFRQAPRLASSRRGAAAISLRAAALDLEFKHLVERADRARDGAEWGPAAELYRQALRAYPEHFGYLVQHAHCLKEQGQFAQAECFYRSALALGAPRPDVYDHLAYVAMQQGFPVSFDGEDGPALLDTEPLDAPPTQADVELLVYLLLEREPPGAEVLQLLRAHRTIRSLITEIVHDGSFISANAHLLWTASYRHRTDHQ